VKCKNFISSILIATGIATTILITCIVNISYSSDIKNQAEKFINAAINNDFDYYFNNSYDYRQRVRRIEVNEPKYKQDEQKSHLYRISKDSVINFKVTTGDNLPYLFYLFKFPCNWKVLEVKKEPNTFGRLEKNYSAYVEINYKNPQNSPHGNSSAGVSGFRHDPKIKHLVIRMELDSKGLYYTYDEEKDSIISW